MMRGELDLSRRGAKAWVTIAGEMALVSTHSRRSCREKSVGQIPALLIKMSSFPCWDSTSLTAAAMETSDVMSSWTREMDARGLDVWIERSDS